MSDDIGALRSEWSISLDYSTGAFYASALDILGCKQASIITMLLARSKNLRYSKDKINAKSVQR